MPADYLKRFSLALRQKRAAIGLTQAELAEAIGMAVESFGRLERGVALPRTATLIDIARVLRCTTDEVLGLTPILPRPAKLGPELQALLYRARSLEPRNQRLLSVLATQLAVAKSRRTSV